MIVKIQRPLYTTADSPPALVYNKDRSFLNELDWDDDLAVWFKNPNGTLAAKIYAEIEILPDCLAILKRAEDENW